MNRRTFRQDGMSLRVRRISATPMGPMGSSMQSVERSVLILPPRKHQKRISIRVCASRPQPWRPVTPAPKITAWHLLAPNSKHRDELIWRSSNVKPTYQPAIRSVGAWNKPIWQANRKPRLAPLLDGKDLSLVVKDKKEHGNATDQSSFPRGPLRSWPRSLFPSRGRVGW